jgi:hypothetical protein
MNSAHDVHIILRWHEIIVIIIVTTSINITSYYYHENLNFSAVLQSWNKTYCYIFLYSLIYW